MVLSTMFHADEVLPVDALEPAPPSDLRKKEKDMAELLVNTLSGPFEPERYPDEYRKRLTALIEGRAASAAPAPHEVVTGNGIQDLMAALQASVEQARAVRKGKPTKAAAKTVAKRKKKSA
jgi:DNA end-binding protein Ku